MLLELSDLVAGYGAKTVISDVSFALEPGQILAFLGHNGAGKTTTLKTVMGLLPLRAGEVMFDGHRIDRLDVSQRVAMGLRLLPEGRGIFPDLSVAENIDVVAARNAGDKAMFGIGDVYRLFPALAERRTTRAGSLSGMFDFRRPSKFRRRVSWNTGTLRCWQAMRAKAGSAASGSSREIEKSCITSLLA